MWHSKQKKKGNKYCSHHNFCFIELIFNDDVCWFFVCSTLFYFCFLALLKDCKYEAEYVFILLKKIINIIQLNFLSVMKSLALENYLLQHTHYRRFSRINERKRQYTLIVHNNYSINRALFKSIGIESKLEFIALHRKIGNNL